VFSYTLVTDARVCVCVCVRVCVRRYLAVERQDNALTITRHRSATAKRQCEAEYRQDLRTSAVCVRALSTLYRRLARPHARTHDAAIADDAAAAAAAA